MKKKPALKYYFYILKCRDRSLYCGITTDLSRRAAAHNAGKGSAYVRSRGGGHIVYSEQHKNKSAALKREAEVKKWTRLEKLELVRSGNKKTRQ